jgi:hypothetical protein
MTCRPAASSAAHVSCDTPRAGDHPGAKGALGVADRSRRACPTIRNCALPFVAYVEWVRGSDRSCPHTSRSTCVRHFGVQLSEPSYCGVDMQPRQPRLVWRGPPGRPRAPHRTGGTECLHYGAFSRRPRRRPCCRRVRHSVRRFPEMTRLPPPARVIWTRRGWVCGDAGIVTCSTLLTVPVVVAAGTHAMPERSMFCQCRRCLVRPLELTVRIPLQLLHTGFERRSVAIRRR